MERYGLVTLEKHADGSVAPRVAYDELSVIVPIIADRDAA